MKSRQKPKHLWYWREIEIPENWRGKQIYLCIGAADYHCTGYINGKIVGSHEGGYTPMAWRIDPCLKKSSNSICLHVEETTNPKLPRGKQTHLPWRYAVFYKPYSGIWQSVWLEARGMTFVKHVNGVTSNDGASFIFQVAIGGDIHGDLRLALIHPDGSADASITVPIESGQMSVQIQPQRPARWSPHDPNIYQVVCAVEHDGKVIDRVQSYAGLRTIEIQNGKVLLNGVPFYQKLVLYQAYYPDGWATATEDAVLRADVELIKSLGFNGLRIHQTLADPRLLYWCDRLGLVVWGEMPSPFVFARVNRRAFELLLREALERDLGHPSIISWVLFNETWGILDIFFSRKSRAWVRDMIRLCRSLDPTRLIIDNSGYDHLETDLLDIHHYLSDPEHIRRLYAALANPASLKHRFWRHFYMMAPNRIAKSPLAPTGVYRGEPVIISECGGYGFGPYRGKKMGLRENLEQVIQLINEFPHLQGFAYTQLHDIEQERNGLATFDRQVKIDPTIIKSIIDRVGN